MSLSDPVAHKLLSPEEERHTIRALDQLSTHLRGLQETGIPALALSAATADAFDMAAFSLLVRAYQLVGPGGFAAALTACREMLKEMAAQIDRYESIVPGLDVMGEPRDQLLKAEADYNTRQDARDLWTSLDPKKARPQ